MAGIDIPIPELQISVHQPVIRDIAFMGEPEFFMAMQYICVDKEALIQDKNLLATLSNFQVFMKVLQQSQDKTKKDSVQTLLLLLFPERQSTFLPSSIILTAEGCTPVIIDDNNFSIVQEYVKTVLCVNNIFQGDNIVYNPANAAAQAIADKLMAGRRKVAQQKSANGKNESILTRYVSVLTVGIDSMNLEDCLNLTLFQLFDLMERFTASVEWHTDMRVRLAGGQPEKTVESWMRDLHPINKKTPNPTPQEHQAPSTGAAFRGGRGWVNT